MRLMEVILQERYINLFFNDQEKREHYAPAVWEILQRTYAKLGGIKGTGFESPQSMIEQISMWKLVKRDGRIIAVKMYKDRGGRKSVASGTDGSKEGIQALAKMMWDDIVQHRSYGEVSKDWLDFAMRRLGPELVQSVLIPAQKAKAILSALGEEVSLIPGEEYWYQREIGGELLRKIMLGTPGHEILPRDSQKG